MGNPLYAGLDNSREPQFSRIFAISLLCVVIGGIWNFIPHPIIIVLAGLAPIAIVGVLYMPFVVCLGFIIFSFFRIHEAFIFLMPFKIPLLLALASLGALGWHLVITRKIQPFITPELKWFLVFFALVTLGLLFASNRGMAISMYTGSYSKIAIMVFAIAWMVREEKQFAILANMIVIAGIAIGLVALNNKANGIGLVEGTRVTIARDIRSVLGDPNDQALVLSFPISFAAGLALTTGRSMFVRCLGVVGYFVIASAIIATQSRGGLLAILAVSGVFGLYKIKSKLLLIGLGMIALVGLLAMAGISDRSSGGAGESGIDESAAGRLYAWQAAFGMANTHPLTGVGLNNFTSNYFFYSPHWDGMNHAVHSTWFGVLAETGYVGLIVFIILTVKLVSGMRRLVNNLLPLYQQGKCSAVIFGTAQSVLAGLAGFMVSGTFLTQGFTWPLYILLAVSVAVTQVGNRILGQVEEANPDESDAQKAPEQKQSQSTELVAIKPRGENR